MSSGVLLVVTDLDGSLLDHDDYSYAAALPVLELLESMRIPVIFASSKTRAEILALRAEMGNEHPFIVENGAAVLIPEGYFLKAPEHTALREGYWVRELAPPRATWAAPLAALRRHMPDCFQDFASAGVDEIVAMTGLTPVRAKLAREREYSEPVQWRGSAAQLATFLQTLADAGATVSRGGRFYSVAGDSDKGRALLWLRQQYALAAGQLAVYDLALGDGENDVPMLEVAHRAVPIPAHGRSLPTLARIDGIIPTEGFGPSAWALGVQRWLQELYRPPDE